MRARELRTSLRNAGFSQSAIKAAWPEWWTDASDNSASARNELRFSLARKLGLDPSSLVREDSPKFIWSDRTKYKRLTAETDFERSALASFGIGVARAVINGTKALPEIPAAPWSAGSLRATILKMQPYVRLPDVVGACWSLGIALVYLRVFPVAAKRMVAMSVRVGHRYVILVGQNTRYPAPVAYYVAHELGHIALGHLKEEGALIDVGDPLRATPGGADEEEAAADKFALELLTGRPDPQISTLARSFLAYQLAQVSIQSSRDLQIEPGTIALCFGHTTGRWNKAYGALKYIYGDGAEVWRAINEFASKSLDWDGLSEEMARYLDKILGLSPND